MRVILDQTSVTADIICKEGVSRHLKENKFRSKQDLVLVPLPAPTLF